MVAVNIYRIWFLSFYIQCLINIDLMETAPGFEPGNRGDACLLP